VNRPPLGGTVGKSQSSFDAVHHAATSQAARTPFAFPCVPRNGSDCGAVATFSARRLDFFLIYRITISELWHNFTPPPSAPPRDPFAPP
jgi:hypothetical protein